MKTLLSILLIGCPFLTFSSALYAQSKETPVFSISGEVNQPMELGISDLENLEPVHIEIEGMDGKSTSYKGVNLYAVLKMAGVLNNESSFYFPKKVIRSN